MPRYFFHIASHDDFVEDLEGVEIAGEQEARVEATNAARELVSERIRRGLAVDLYKFDVRDENGRQLFELPFLDVLRLI